MTCASCAQLSDIGTGSMDLLLICRPYGDRMKVLREIATLQEVTQQGFSLRLVDTPTYDALFSLASTLDRDREYFWPLSGISSTLTADCSTEPLRTLKLPGTRKRRRSDLADEYSDI